MTSSGIASRLFAAPYRYQIDAERLLATESLSGRQLYTWPVHLVRMAWVNPDLFFEGFKAGIDVHQGRYPEKVDLRLLEESSMRPCATNALRFGTALPGDQRLPK